MEFKDYIVENQAPLADISSAEHNPAYDAEVESDEYGKEPADAMAAITAVVVEHLLTEELMGHHTQSVIGTPDDKVEGSAMPKAANQEREEIIQIRAQLPLTVATQ